MALRYPISLLSRIIAITVFSFASLQIASTQDVIRCHSDEKMQEYSNTHPGYLQEIEEGMLDFKSNRIAHQRSSSVVTIAVHVIVIHPTGLPVGSGANIDLDRIESQIEVLNEDFRRENADAGNIPSDFVDIVADPEIEFCLASVDPEGYDTDGITRYAYDGNFTANEYTVKQATTWDRSSYLNIWVVPNIGPLGWAYLPSTSSLPDPVEDGVVVLTGAFGGPGEATFAPYNLGRTATHEVGHYLGLRHVWGNGSGGCGTDDNMDDTPLQFDENYNCPNHPSPSCVNSGDMFMNYMDYVDDNCMNSFSKDQADYMQLILSTSRSSLGNSSNTACGNGISPITLELELIDFVDVTCPGGTDGIIEVEAYDGEAPYTYTLQETGESNSDGYFDNLEEGDYTILVEDNDGNTTEIEVDILEPNQFFTHVTILEDVSCIGASDGEVDIIVGGGNGFYTFDVPGQEMTADSDIGGLAAGDYVITVVDSEGCQVLVDFELEAPDTLHLLVDTLISVSCYGGSDGSITLDTDGGTGFVSTYQILPDSSIVEATSFADLPQDTFTFYAEDFNGCTDTSKVVMTQPDSLQLLLDSLIAPVCFGDSTAQLILAPSGGNTTFTYLYDTFTITTDTLVNLYADTFLITAIDENNCMDTTSFIIENPEMDILTIDELIGAECGGTTLGSATLSNSSIHTPITYTLDSDTNDTGYFDGLAEGDYLVTAVDTLGCEALTEFSIATSGGVDVSISNIINIDCAGDETGAFTVDVSEGSGYMYSIDGVNFQDDQSFTDLAAADYTVSVLDDEGCITESMITLTAPEPLGVTLVGKSDNICNGESNGEAQLELTGGSGMSVISINGEQGSLNPSDLIADIYTVVVTDENDCTATLTFTIDQPSPIEVISMSTTRSACLEDTGSISLEAIGGNGQLTYILNGAEQSQGQFDNLPSQVYTVSIRDEEGCTIEQLIEVEQSADIDIIINDIRNESCAGQDDGNIDFDVNGGTGIVTLELNQEEVTQEDLTNLSPGDYTLRTVDEVGCSDMIMFTIEEATPISMTLLSSDDITCSGGSDGRFEVSAQGGTGNYIYTSITGTNTDGVFTNLSDVNYDVTVTDENGCEATLMVSLDIPQAVELESYESAAPLCFGDNTASVSFIATGGNGNYTYSIAGQTDLNGTINNLNAGTFIVSIADSNGCEGSGEITIEDGPLLDLAIANQTALSCRGNSDASLILLANAGVEPYSFTIGSMNNSTGVFEGLSSGNYTALVTDDNGCSQAVLVEIADGVELEYTINTSPALCANNASGAATVSAINGNPPYEYTLDNTTNTTGQFDNLTAGDYPLEINDANGCITNGVLTIEESQTLMVSEVVIEDTRCHNTATGAFLLDVNGGTGDYMIEVDGQEIDGTEASMLTAGDYMVVITDSNGCSITESITINDAPLLEISIESADSPRCFGESNGQVELSAVGGTGAYTYSLGGETNMTGVFDNLASDLYAILVTDQNGCNVSDMIALDDPTPITVEIITQPVLCADGSDGSALIITEGGTGELAYSLENGIPQLESNFSTLEPNDYTVIVSDSNECSISSAFTIENTLPIDTVSIEVTSIDLDQGLPGQIVIEASGGMQPYRYALDGINFQESNTLEVMDAGNQTISIQDANDCIQTFDIIVNNYTRCEDVTIDQALDISINPNPVINTVNLVYCNSEEQTIRYSIFDDRGRYITGYDRLHPEGLITESIDVSGYPIGIYIIGISIDIKNFHYRFAKIE